MEIAIVGARFSLPGARCLNDVWDLLNKKNDQVPKYIKSEDFIPSFFGLAEIAKDHSDPQLQELLVLAYRCLEDLNLGNSSYRPKTGVFLSANGNLIQGEAGGSRSFINELEEQSLYTPTGIAGRLSFHLDLKGPSLAIDCGFASSLVAVHEACKSLAFGDCEVGLIATASIDPRINQFIYEEGSVLSGTGECNPYTTMNNGTVLNNGACVIALKTLENARRDGDQILAVIKGSAISNDGSKSHYFRTDAAAQVDLIREALSRSGVLANEISYLEGHGTGTPIGDLAEITAFHEVFGHRGPEIAPCFVGSFKSRIGHLRYASGTASLIKAIAIISNNCIPQEAAAKESLIGTVFPDSSLQLPEKPIKFTIGETINIGVSAYGMGGFGSHLVLSSPPKSEPANLRETGLGNHLLVLTSKSRQGLSEQVADLNGKLDSELASRNCPKRVLHTFSAASCLGRDHFKYRSYFTAKDLPELSHKIKNYTSQQIEELTENTKLCFLISGQGGQYHQMGKDLYEVNSCFRNTIDTIDRIAFPYLERSLIEILWGTDTKLIEQTRYVQPALFALEYGLLKFWESMGVKPDLIVGHSFGEYAGACFAGVFSLHDAVKLICARGRLMSDSTTPGAMLVVNLGCDALEDKIESLGLSNTTVAVINSASTVVAAGSSDEIKKLADYAENNAIRCKRLLLHQVVPIY